MHLMESLQAYANARQHSWLVSQVEQHEFVQMISLLLAMQARQHSFPACRVPQPQVMHNMSLVQIKPNPAWLCDSVKSNTAERQAGACWFSEPHLPLLVSTNTRVKPSTVFTQSNTVSRF